MLNLLRETWGRIQEDLRHKTGAAAYEAWIKDLKPLALERGICHFEAQTKLAAERVRRLYGPLLEQALCEAFGCRIGIQIGAPQDGLVPDQLEVGPTRPIVGDFNETAVLYLSGLLEGKELPGRLFVFHGPKEAGKTFLLRWFSDLYFQKHKQKVSWLSGETLLRTFQSVLRDGRTVDLRAELSVDRPLVLDELHRVSGHMRIQYELEQLLKVRLEMPVPTLCISRYLPRDIRSLRPGLQSLLSSGHLAALTLPGIENRLQYLRALAGSASRNGRAAAIEDVARDVKGSLVDVRRAWLAVRKGLPLHQGSLRFIDPGALFRQLSERIAARLDLKIEEIVGLGQGRRASLARQLLAWCCLREGMSQAEIGRYMDGRSRAAVHYAVRTIEKRIETDPDIRALAMDIRN